MHARTPVSGCLARSRRLFRPPLAASAAFLSGLDGRTAIAFPLWETAEYQGFGMYPEFRARRIRHFVPVRPALAVPRLAADAAPRAAPGNGQGR